MFPLESMLDPTERKDPRNMLITFPVNAILCFCIFSIAGLNECNLIMLREFHCTHLTTAQSSLWHSKEENYLAHHKSATMARPEVPFSNAQAPNSTLLFLLRNR